MRKNQCLLVAVLIASAYVGVPAQPKANQRAAHSFAYALELRPGRSAPDAAGSSSGHVVRVEGAPWLRLHVADYALGQQSYITFTSLLDGGKQRLDAKSLLEWRKNTAFFNGNAVRVELHSAKGETNDFVRFTDVTVGVTPTVKHVADPTRTDPTSPITICGTNDDRVPSNDSRVGRINLLNTVGNTSIPYCTAWIVSNGALLTAGHCVDQNFDGTVDATFLTDVVEFNVPPSLPNGTTVFSNPDSQYPIANVAGMRYDGPGTGLGKDWAVFSVNRNSNTGILPQAVQSYFRMTSEAPIFLTESVTVTGYGIDNTPVGTTGSENAQTRTLQTHSGLFVGEAANGPDVAHFYQVDTMQANSGSPIIWDNTGYTIGIHTSGLCTSTDGSNVGTSFEHDPLENTLQNFPGPNTRYVDSATHPNIGIAPRDGTVFRPFATVANGVSAAPNGGTVSIAPGTYNGFTVFDRPMTIRVGAGTATIGP